MSIPIALCDIFPGTETRSFITTRVGSCEQAQIKAAMFPERVVRMTQTHSANVTCYRPSAGPALDWRGDTQSSTRIPQRRSILEGGICLPDTDSVWTAETDTLLLVKTADCLPITFYHPSGIVGVIHAGRKGLHTGIIANTFKDVCLAIENPKKYDITLKKNKTSTPVPFWIHYGTCICVRCYQIESEINLHMDLRQHAVAQVHQVLADHEIRETFSPFCTLCHRHLFFSYRGGDATERLYSGIMKPSRQ